jgi:D-glycero-D-manno-heptose 1,7-bisphosphate phosphatase
VNGIVFLDRDGTLIEDDGYICDPSRLREIPGAAEALRRLVRGGYLIAIVSNQAGLARGKFREEEMKAFHRTFIEYFRERGVSFHGTEYCPHHPEGTVAAYRKVCDCRKPATGMAERILARLALSASCRKWVVGDKMSDVEMGKRLGAVTILVATGHGEKARRDSEKGGERPDAFLPGIREAADWILSSKEVR